MRGFDSKAMKDRVWSRYLGATRTGRRRGRTTTAAASWARDTTAVDDLEILINWCASRKVSVVFECKTNGIYSPGLREIALPRRMRPLRQVAILLHECGHTLVADGADDDRFGMGYPLGDKRKWRTLAHRFAVLDEEMEAWRRGWKLATRLGLSIDRASYDAIRFECLKTYLHWVLTPGPMPDDEVE